MWLPRRANLEQLRRSPRIKRSVSFDDSVRVKRYGTIESPGLCRIFFVRSIDLLGKSKGQRWHIALKRMELRNVMVQTLTRALKMYVSDVNQQDWDEYAERLTFAINTAQDRVRGETPFFLIHGWDPRSTLEATLPLGSTRRRDREPRRWRYHVQQHYQRARDVVNERLKMAILTRADQLNEDLQPHEIKPGTQVW